MAEVLRRTAENPAMAAQVPFLAGRLQKNAAALIELLSAVLDNAHLESGRLEYRESVFSLDELLTSICSELNPLARAKGLQLLASCAARPLCARTDRVKLYRVVSNLIANAIKFSESGGVTVTAHAADNVGVVIEVQDTGIGIESQELKRIFNEFAQLRDPLAGRNSGWGLGLSICRRLVDLMGGTMTVDSMPGRGSTFRVHLPAGCASNDVDPGPSSASLRRRAPRESLIPAPSNG
jgi:signal transduction histidine kinase